ncbi:MAG: NAD-binding protein [Anaerolineae bacterium]|nr:NAD-binding protein [Anaerolineae bacterium]
MKIIILGCGRLGSYLARRLQEEGHKVTVVDNDSMAFDRLVPGLDVDLVVGTGIDEDVLRRAGIEQADAFVAVTNRDNTNVMAAQVAKEVFGIRRVVCRIYDHLREEIYRDLGLETVCPTVLGANQIHDILAA